jgi:DUF971 family protein
MSAHGLLPAPYAQQVLITTIRKVKKILPNPLSTPRSVPGNDTWRTDPVKTHDRYESACPLQHFREQCPRASCKGETVLFHTYAPVKLAVMTPGRYELKNVQQVGDYAIQVFWGDGHQTEIYSWEYLRGLCPCDECRVPRGRQDQVHS